VFEELAKAGGDALLGEVIGKESGVGGDPCCDVLTIEEFKEGVEGLGLIGVRSVNGASPCALAVPGEFFAIPLFRPFDGPVYTFFFVTTVAGVGDSQLLSETGVRVEKAMIGTRINLHVSTLRHVAFHATITGAVGGVEAVFGRDDNGGVVESALVTAHTEEVVFGGKDEGVAMRVMAVETGDSGVPHSAHAEGTVDKDFVANLPIVKI
jgi:hypothetical protein